MTLSLMIGRGFQKLEACAPAKSAAAFCEDLFDFVFYGKTADFRLREDYFAIDHYIELAGLAWLHLDFFAEAGVE